MMRKLVILICLLWQMSANAALDLELTQGISGALPIIVLPFTGESFSEDKTDIASVISHDLYYSGRFQIIESSGEENNAEQWRNLGTDNVVMGKVNINDQGTFTINFQLIDVVGQKSILLNQEYLATADDLRSVAHQISDQIYYQLTGEHGIFSTRVAYVKVEDLSASKKRYILEVADADGYNPQPLVISTDPVMSPAWSPTGNEIAYVSFENKHSQIYRVNLISGERKLITDYPGINGAPTWSPDGRKLAVVLSKDGSPKIYTVDLSNGKLRQLTYGVSIDTEPNWSPSGDEIIFTSDRGGSPQIYRLNLRDNNLARLTFSGTYNARASYTPDGRDIVMIQRSEDGRFNIVKQDLASGIVIPLTAGGKTESPSVAPNGKMVIYTGYNSDRAVLNITSTDGRVNLRLPALAGNVQEPAWSPFL